MSKRRGVTNEPSDERALLANKLCTFIADSPLVQRDHSTAKYIIITDKGSLRQYCGKCTELLKFCFNMVMNCVRLHLFWQWRIFLSTLLSLTSNSVSLKNIVRQKAYEIILWRVYRSTSKIKVLCFVYLVLGIKHHFLQTYACSTTFYELSAPDWVYPVFLIYF